jgi:hypothetical protein
MRLKELLFAPADCVAVGVFALQEFARRLAPRSGSQWSDFFCYVVITLNVATTAMLVFPDDFVTYLHSSRPAQVLTVLPLALLYVALFYDDWPERRFAVLAKRFPVLLANHRPIAILLVAATLCYALLVWPKTFLAWSKIGDITV